MKRWQFGQTMDQRWYWRRFNDDGTQTESARMFGSRVHCIADAFEHGYMSSQRAQSSACAHIGTHDERNPICRKGFLEAGASMSCVVCGSPYRDYCLAHHCQCE